MVNFFETFLGTVQENDLHTSLLDVEVAWDIFSLGSMGGFSIGSMDFTFCAIFFLSDRPDTTEIQFQNGCKQHMQPCRDTQNHETCIYKENGRVKNLLKTDLWLVIAEPGLLTAFSKLKCKVMCFFSWSSYSYIT